MIKRIFTIASAIALCGTFVAKAEFGGGVVLNPGLSMMGGAYKYKDEKNADKTSDNDLGFAFDGGLFGQYGIGDEEMIKVKLYLGFGMKTLAIKAIKENGSTESKSPISVSQKNLAFNLGVDFDYLDFDGGCMYSGLGLAGYYTLSKDVKVKGDTKKWLKEKQKVADDKVTAEEKEVSKMFKDFNIGADVTLVGVRLMDKGISVGLGGRFYFMDLVDKNNKYTKNLNGTDGKTGIQKLGNGNIDVVGSITIDIVKLIS